MASFKASRAPSSSCCSNQLLQPRTLAIACGLLVLFVLLFANQPADPADVAAAAQHTDRSSRATSAAPVLAGQREEIEGTEVVWQVPAGKPRGLLLTFHGCSHSAIDWWPKGSSCDTCIGLPEEVLITSTALSRGYAVAAVSSRDRGGYGCWDVPHQPGAHTADTTSVVAVVSALQQRPELKSLPLYALGASSGGAFALTLTAYLSLTAVCSQIMALPPTLYTALLDARQQQQQTKGKGVKQWPEPPVMFVHMPRDAHTAARVQQAVQIRQAKGLHTKVVEVPPQPLTAQLLARIPELSTDSAQQLLQLFTAAGVTDQHPLLGVTDQQGMLVEDPRSAGWHKVVQNSGIPGLKDLNLTPDQSGLSEVLNMAYAQHEIIADTTQQMLDWFEQQPVVAAGR